MGTRRFEHDPRLGYLPRHAPPYRASEVFGAWQAIARRQLGLPDASVKAVASDLEAFRTIAWTVTRREGDYELAETRRIFDRLEHLTRSNLPRWSIAADLGAGIIRARWDSAVDNRDFLERMVGNVEDAHHKWRRKRVAELRAEGNTWTEIAERLGISVVTARRNGPEAAADVLAAKAPGTIPGTAWRPAWHTTCPSTRRHREPPRAA